MSEGKRLTISELIEGVMPCIVAKRYSENYVKGFRQIFNQLLVYCEERGVEYFSAELAQQFLYEHYMLNLHATFTKGTIEFRLFQFDKPTAGRKGGIHAGQLKSYIQLCLALNQMAKDAKSASPKPQRTENPKYAMRTWLLRLGFIGDEFAAARAFLTRNLDGDGAFRRGRPAA